MPQSRWAIARKSKLHQCGEFAQSPPAQCPLPVASVKLIVYSSPAIMSTSFCGHFILNHHLSTIASPILNFLGSKFWRVSYLPMDDNFLCVAVVVIKFDIHHCVQTPNTYLQSPTLIRRMLCIGNGLNSPYKELCAHRRSWQWEHCLNSVTVFKHRPHRSRSIELILQAKLCFRSYCTTDNPKKIGALLHAYNHLRHFCSLTWQGRGCYFKFVDKT